MSGYGVRGGSAAAAGEDWPSGVQATDAKRTMPKTTASISRCVMATSSSMDDQMPATMEADRSSMQAYPVPAASLTVSAVGSVGWKRGSNDAGSRWKDVSSRRQKCRAKKTSVFR